jgi:hypothetical protein
MWSVQIAHEDWVLSLGGTASKDVQQRLSRRLDFFSGTV